MKRLRGRALWLGSLWRPIEKNRDRITVVFCVAFALNWLLAPFLLQIGAFFHSPWLVRESVWFGADLEARDNDRTALIYAIEQRDEETVAALLAVGANPNVTFDIDPDSARRLGIAHVWRYNSALMIAAEDGDSAIVAALLKAGADANATREDGSTALDIARSARKDAERDNPPAPSGYDGVIALLQPESARPAAPVKSAENPP